MMVMVNSSYIEYCFVVFKSRVNTVYCISIRSQVKNWWKELRKESVERFSTYYGS